MAIAAGMLGVAYVIFRNNSEVARGAADTSLSAAIASSSPAAAGGSRSATVQQTAPTLLAPVPSWEGTEVAGDIHLDGAGNIIPDHALRTLFDYMLSAIDEISDQQIRAHLLDVGRHHQLTDAQLAELDGLFSKYRDYLRAASAIKSDSSNLADLRKAFDARHWMRRDMLGFEMADGFFAGSEVQDRYQLDRMEVMNDVTLTNEQRAQRLEAVIAAEEPAEVHAARQPSRDLVELQKTTDQMRKAGASADDIQAMRVQSVGTAAAERLSALDQEQTVWNQRVQTLGAARRQILSDPAVADADKQSRIDDYLDQNFSGTEALRARALLGLKQN